MPNISISIQKDIHHDISYDKQHKALSLTLYVKPAYQNFLQNANWTFHRDSESCTLNDHEQPPVCESNMNISRQMFHKKNAYAEWFKYVEILCELVTFAIFLLFFFILHQDRDQLWPKSI